MCANSATAQRQGHDPAGRRRAIVTAAIEVIAEVGIQRTTHRLIASKAAVPLGATTYYFPTLRDLVKTAIDEVILETRAYVDSWNEPLSTSTDIAGTLVDLLREYIGRRDRALLEYDIYLASTRNTELQPVAGVWHEEVPTMLQAHMPRRCAQAVSVILNGFMFESVVSNTDVDPVLLRHILGLVISDSSQVGPVPKVSPSTTAQRKALP